MPGCQFGFYPGRSTAHPIYIIRHLVDAAKARPPRHPEKHVFSAFIDFKQAYDKIDREMLWSHLSGIGVPDELMQILRDIYHGDSYVLVDGHKRTEAVHPTVGVKQGCPLSPLLFSLFVNDVESFFMSDRGAESAHAGVQIPLVMYADDTTLLSNTRKDMEVLLTSLARYARHKKLVVNVDKSCVMVFNARRKYAPFKYEGMPLSFVDEFKYLGVHLKSSCSMEHAANSMGGAFMAGIRRVGEYGEEFSVKGRPHVMLQLFQTFAISGAMYGCQVWGTHFLNLENRDKCALSAKHAGFCKRLLGVKRSTANEVILRECGQLPLHFYWFRAVIRCWNDMLKSNSRLLTDVVLADRCLLRDAKSSWCKDLHQALLQLDGCAEQAVRIKEGRALDLGVCLRQYMQSIYGMWDAHVGDPRDPHEMDGRKHVTYHAWFGLDFSESVRLGVRPPLPGYLRYWENANHVRAMARFRTSSHHLRVETGRHSRTKYRHRRCQHCGFGVEDEKHAACICPFSEHLRIKHDFTHDHDLDVLLTWFGTKTSSTWTAIRMS